MSTATASQMFTMRVRFTADQFHIESQSGAKKLWIDLRRFDAVAITDAEQTVIYSMMNGPMGRPHNVEVSREDLLTLVGIRDKCNVVPVTAEAVEGFDAPAPVKDVKGEEIARPALRLPRMICGCGGLCDSGHPCPM